MAKLNGVILTDEAIKYSGAKYEKVVVTPQAGDILRAEDSDYGYVTNGAYYEVDYVDSCYDPHIIDNDGDGFDCADIEYALFRKVSEPLTSSPQRYREVCRSAKVGERIKIVDRDASERRYKNGDEFVVTGSPGNDDVYVNGTCLVLKEEYVVLEPIAEQSEDIIEVASVKYRKVDRKPQVGDFVYMQHYDEGLTKGKVYEIHRLDSDGDGVFYDNDGDERCFRINRNGRQLVERFETVADLEAQLSELQVKIDEKKAEEEKARDPRNAFAKGDKVRLISGGDEHPLHGFKNGEVYTVSSPNTTWHSSKRVEIVSCYHQGYALPEEIVKLTEKEVAELNRLKVGEYAKVVGKTSLFVSDEIDVNSIVEITAVDNTDIPYQAKAVANSEWAGWFGVTQLTRATDEEVAEAKRKLEEKKIVVGAYVKLTIEEGKRPAHGWGGVSNGDIGVVRSLSDGSVVYVDFPEQNDWRGILSELTVLSGEEVAAEKAKAEEVAKWAKIGRKVNEFKVGDVIEITKDQYGDWVGSTVVVKEINGKSLYYKSNRTSGVFVADFHAVKLIAPIESVVNLTVSE